MDDNKVAFRHLARRVAGETVTYRLLSRELGITVSAAKLVLEAYLAEPSTAQKNVGATYALTGTLKEADVDAGAMDVDTDSVVAISRRTTLLVQAADLQTKLSLFATPPTQFIYSLSPGPLVSLDILAAFSLSTIDPTAVSKWKPAPAEGYGTIVHPEGERRKKVDKKGKGKAVIAPKIVASTSKPSMFGSTKDKDAAGKEKAKPVVRKIGERGGLFARAEPAVVPKKRKASPPPPPVKKVPEKAKKVVSNGIFGDEEVEDEEDDEEEAMREMEEEIARENKAKAAHPGETKAQREKRELQEMMDQDDDDIVAVSTKKSPPKKVVKAAPKAQGKLSFGGK